MFLKNDEYIFNDFLDIVKETVDAFLKGTILFNEEIWQVDDMQSLVDLLKGFYDGNIFQGINYWKIGHSFGDIIARLMVDLYS